MNLYVMRHGTTVWNEKHISQGRSQNRLSKSGKELVEQSATMCKNTPFDIIVSSPLMRTMQTSNIMNKYHNVKIVKDDRIIEIDQGVFAGKKVSTLSEKEKLQRIERAKECGMEQFDEIFERTKNFFENLKKDYPYQNILVVTHNWIASLIEGMILNKDIDLKSIRHWATFDNAQVKHFVI